MRVSPITGSNNNLSFQKFVNKANVNEIVPDLTSSVKEFLAHTKHAKTSPNETTALINDYVLRMKTLLLDAINVNEKKVKASPLTVISSYDDSKISVSIFNDVTKACCSHEMDIKKDPLEIDTFLQKVKTSAKELISAGLDYNQRVKYIGQSKIPVIEEFGLGGLLKKAYIGHDVFSFEKADQKIDGLKIVGFSRYGHDYQRTSDPAIWYCDDFKDKSQEFSNYIVDVSELQDIKEYLKSKNIIF